jgi:hypothetical protein
MTISRYLILLKRWRDIGALEYLAAPSFIEEPAEVPLGHAPHTTKPVSR